MEIKVTARPFGKLYDTLEEAFAAGAEARPTANIIACSQATVGAVLTNFALLNARELELQFDNGTYLKIQAEPGRVKCEVNQEVAVRSGINAENVDDCVKLKFETIEQVYEWRPKAKLHMRVGLKLILIEEWYDDVQLIFEKFPELLFSSMDVVESGDCMLFFSEP